MTKKIANCVNRIHIYLQRLRQDMANRNPTQGMADAAEIAEQARRLWKEFERETNRQ